MFRPPDFALVVSIRVAGSVRAVFEVVFPFLADFRMIIHPCGDTHGATGIVSGLDRIGVARAQVVSGGWGMNIKGNAA